MLQPEHRIGGYTSVIVADILVAIVIITGMLVGGQGVVVSVISGVVFYGVTTLAALSILSGAVTTIVVARLEHTTLRHRDLLQVEQKKGRVQVLPATPLQLTDSRPPADYQQAPSFVSPYTPVDSAARAEALIFASGLYGADGLPDPKKIVLDTIKESPGRLKVAAPRGEARQWLLDRDILLDLTTGFQLNLDEYPSIEALRPVM